MDRTTGTWGKEHLGGHADQRICSEDEDDDEEEEELNWKPEKLS